MKAAFYYRPNEIKVEEIDIPKINDNEMLLHVRTNSICGTDLRISRHGHFKIPSGQKRVLGHEIAGEIVQVGKLVDGFHEGMRVTTTPNIGCGFCEFCRDGFNNMCPNYEALGISFDGGFEEYMLVPSIAIKGGNIFPIPEHVSFEEASLIEPMSCCYNALRSVNTTPADVVLIIGAGSIGALHAILNRIAGAKKIMAADIRQDRLEKIKDFGVDVTINTSLVNLKDTVMTETNGRGVDVIITAVSVAEVQAQAVDLLATHGRVNFFAGLGKGVLIQIDTNRVHYKGLRLVGTTGSTNSDYARCLQLVADGRANLERLVTRTFTLDEINQAFEYAAAGEGLKAMIVNN